MTSQSLRSKAVKGAMWTLLEHFTTQLVGFCDDYGTVAQTGILFAITILADVGFGNALIQRNSLSDKIRIPPRLTICDGKMLLLKA